MVVVVRSVVADLESGIAFRQDSQPPVCTDHGFFFVRGRGWCGASLCSGRIGQN